MSRITNDRIFFLFSFFSLHRSSHYLSSSYFHSTHSHLTRTIFGLFLFVISFVCRLLYGRWETDFSCRKDRHWKPCTNSGNVLRLAGWQLMERKPVDNSMRYVPEMANEKKKKKWQQIAFTNFRQIRVKMAKFESKADRWKSCIYCDMKSREGRIFSHELLIGKQV